MTGLWEHGSASCNSQTTVSPALAAALLITETECPKELPGSRLRTAPVAAGARASDGSFAVLADVLYTLLVKQYGGGNEAEQQPGGQEQEPGGQEREWQEPRGGQQRR